MVNLQAAYAACERDCRAHYENFPVASLLLPRRMRPHVAALYAFARAADDFADEGDRTVGERHRLIDGWRARLLEAVNQHLQPRHQLFLVRRPGLAGKTRDRKSVV